MRAKCRVSECYTKRYIGVQVTLGFTVLLKVNLSTQLSRYGPYGQSPITMPKKQ